VSKLKFELESYIIDSEKACDNCSFDKCRNILLMNQVILFTFRHYSLDILTAFRMMGATQHFGHASLLLKVHNFNHIFLTNQGNKTVVKTS